jgi:hypothetical protein
MGLAEIDNRSPGSKNGEFEPKLLDPPLAKAAGGVFWRWYIVP